MREALGEDGGLRRRGGRFARRAPRADIVAWRAPCRRRRESLSGFSFPWPVVGRGSRFARRLQLAVVLPSSCLIRADAHAPGEIVTHESLWRRGRGYRMFANREEVALKFVLTPGRVASWRARNSAADRALHLGSKG